MNSKGLSLTEVLIALAVIGVALGIALQPSSMLTTKTDFETSKVQLNRALEQARNWARTRQECVSLSVVAQTVTVQGYLQSPPPQPCPTILSTLPPDTSAYTQVILPPGTTLSPFTTKAGGATISNLVFNTQGGTDYADIALVTVSLTSYTAQFQILPITGQIIE